MQQVTIKTLETKSHPEAKMLFWYLFGASRGGPTRCKIVNLLRNQPYNTNQLSQELGLDYKTITHSLKVLEKNNLVNRHEANYGAMYFTSIMFTENQELFNEIISKLRS